jgi:hypothetical protein
VKIHKDNILYARIEANWCLIHLSKCWCMFYYVYWHIFNSLCVHEELTSDSQTMQLNYICSQLLHVTHLACVVSIWLMWQVMVINKYNSNEFFFVLVGELVQFTIGFCFGKWHIFYIYFSYYSITTKGTIWLPWTTPVPSQIQDLSPPEKTIGNATFGIFWRLDLLSSFR